MKASLKPQEIEAVLHKRLREKGYKLTSQRLAIISLLSKDMTHPGATDIYRKVRKKAPKISMSTVYYTLDMLKGEGLLKEMEFYDRDNRYENTRVRPGSPELAFRQALIREGLPPNDAGAIERKAS